MGVDRQNDAGVVILTVIMTIRPWAGDCSRCLPPPRGLEGGCLGVVSSDRAGLAMWSFLRQNRPWHGHFCGKIVHGLASLVKKIALGAPKPYHHHR